MDRGGRGSNIVEQLFRRAGDCQYRTQTSEFSVKNSLRDQFVSSLTKWSVAKTVSRFSRRLTCIQWHPSYHNVVTFASYAGDIYLWNLSDPSRDVFVEGEGYGNGAITQMYFHQTQPLYLYATSLNGTFSMKDLEGKHTEVYLNTMSKKYWWTSLAISNDAEVMFVGGNTGKAVVLDPAGNILSKYEHFHKDKIHDAEFCPARPWLLATASNDQSVSIWDVRMLTDNSERPLPLSVLSHSSPISSISFDPIYGSSLLTTAQNSELRVYDPHNWSKPALLLKHPHRHFQHMTNIRASWHPFYEDLCIIGRYAETNDTDKTRYVDVVDVRKGEVVGQLYDPAADKITVVSKFNQNGDILATGMGYTAVVWQQARRNGVLSSKTKDQLLQPGRRRKSRDKDQEKKKRKCVEDETSKTVKRYCRRQQDSVIRKKKL